jgi:hypothetical protein
MVKSFRSGFVFIKSNNKLSIFNHPHIPINYVGNMNLPSDSFIIADKTSFNSKNGVIEIFEVSIIGDC